MFFVLFMLIGIFNTFKKFVYARFFEKLTDGNIIESQIF